MSIFKSMTNLTHRKAKIIDLPYIIELLLEDELGASRESKSAAVHENYIKAFHKIDSDPNQYLMDLLDKLKIANQAEPK